MRISRYGFGRIIIDGHRYTKDLLVFPEYVQENWWRERGHGLCLNDLKEVCAFKPKVFIMGCGYFSRLKVPPLVVEQLAGLEIECKILSSQDAVKTFNTLDDPSRTVLGIHLTC